MIKQTFFTLLLLLNITTLALDNHLFFEYKKSNSDQKIMVVNPFPVRNSWAVFHQAVFDAPEYFAYARSHNMPVIVVLPRSIDGFSPLDDAQEWIEGMRVAAAWASMCIRFGEYKTNIHFLTVDPTIGKQELMDHVAAMPCKEIDESDPEKNVALRIHKAAEDTILPPCDVSMEPFFIEKAIKKESRIIKSPFKHDQTSKIVVMSGGAGFIGLHCVQALLQHGYRVIVLDNFICSSKNTLEVIGDNKNFCCIEHDVTETFEIEGDVDLVMHLASVPSPEFYYRLPYQTLASGLQGTKNMLDLAVEKNARFLLASTSEVYGDPTISPQNENYPGNVSFIGKRSQYDQSKRGAETLVKYYVEHHHIDARIARIFNTYGPYMCIDDGRVVTNFIGAILRGKPMKIYGDGKQTRSFAYVSDTVDGLLKCAQHTISSASSIKERVINIGNDNEFTVLELAQKINALAESFGIKSVPLHCVPNIDATDPKMRRPDLIRANSILGYEPSVQLEEGLNRTLAYFKEQKID